MQLGSSLAHFRQKFISLTGQLSSTPTSHTLVSNVDSAIAQRICRNDVRLLKFCRTIGVGILTFDSPFASLGVANGYVGCWLGFAMSAKFCHEKVSQVNSWGTLFTEAASLKRYAVVLGVASTVVFFAGISVGEKSNTYNGKTIWAIVCGAFSLCIAICLFVLHEPLSKHLKWIGIFLVALWIAGVAVITFFGPFIAAGNGYFGSIAALLISVVILHSRSTDASSSDDAVDGGYADPGASVYDRYGDAV
eukprot:m.202652 g.202652  ORF g.202652 m.202652 type:complete len:249 (+) comp18839_c1_seq8:294-1040(+)